MKQTTKGFETHQDFVFLSVKKMVHFIDKNLFYNSNDDIPGYNGERERERASDRPY